MTDAPRNWFDTGGAAYARFRPDYPDALAAALAAAATRTTLALDVGCGSGQFTRQLAAGFDVVVGCDPSADQIAHAASDPRVRYVVASAERLPAEDGTVDLVTAAQAAHWFDLPRFYDEVRRVLVPGGAVALVSYGVMVPEPDLADRFAAFYAQEVGPWWPAERRLVDAGYADVPFPFPERPMPRMEIEREWSSDDFLGYLSTWSAVRAAREAGETAMIDRFATDMARLWGDGPRVVRWPVVVRLGAVSS